MLQELPTEGFAYSLLGAYRSALYERYGWAPVEEELVRAELSPSEPGSVTIAPFTDADLPEVMDLYEETNAERTGPTIRSPQYWRGQLEWLEEDRDGFLLARKEDAALAGYVRSRAGRDDVAEVLELGLRAGDVEAGRALLSAVARRCGHWIRVNLPPSLRTLLRPDQTQITKGTGLMGRAIGLGAVAAALEPAWLGRARASGTRGGSFRVSMHAGAPRCG
jgi:hypothetical protein